MGRVEVGAVEMDPSGWDRRVDWHAHLRAEFEQTYFADLSRFLSIQRQCKLIFPEIGNVFRAFRLTPLRKVKFVMLGQDPYHDDNQAHGLSFSVPTRTPFPPSLKNIFRELVDDVGCPAPTTGNLGRWSEQGGLLLNTVLTVEAHQPNSHRGRGWESFTDAVIQLVSRESSHVVFALWGRQAQSKQSLIDRRHTIIQLPHPSPLSAYRGFLGGRPFSKINDALQTHGQDVIDWALP